MVAPAYLSIINRTNLISTSIHYTARSYSETRSEDSTRINYLYADSVKEILPFYEASAPIYESRISRCVELHFSIGYQYKRLNITYGVILNIIDFYTEYSEYIDNKIFKLANVYSFSRNENFLSLNIKYLLIKNKLPTFIYLGIDNDIKLGIEFNISKINFNKAN